MSSSPVRRTSPSFPNDFCPTPGILEPAPGPISMMWKYGFGYREFLDGWSIRGLLGEGTYGAVYRIVKAGQAPRALKFQILRDGIDIDHFKREVALNQELNAKNADFCLQMYKWKLYRHGRDTIGLIMLEHIRATLEDVLLGKEELTNQEIDDIVSAIGYMLHQLCALGIVHRDLHPANMGFTMRNGKCKMVMLDWGFAIITDECDPCIELMRVIERIKDWDEEGEIPHYPRLYSKLEELWMSFSCGAFDPTETSLGWRDLFFDRFEEEYPDYDEYIRA